MTNGDKIRNMTDEELAESIEPRFFDCSDYCSKFDNGCAFKCKHNRGEDFLLDCSQKEKCKDEIEQEHGIDIPC